MIKAGWWAIAALAWTAVGCVGGDDDPKGAEFGPLFTATSAQVTPNSIYGIWAGHVDAGQSSTDVRFAFTQGMVTASNRCYFAADNFTIIVGVKVKATITASAVTLLEGKDDVYFDGNHRCNVSAKAGTTPYTIDGTRMTSGDLALTKVSD